MTTAIIQIGNTDNKLTQQEWSEFVHKISILMNPFKVHFRGGSAPDAPWQNYCWVFETDWRFDVKESLKELSHAYKQDSIAYTTGETEFLS